MSGDVLFYFCAHSETREEKQSLVINFTPQYFTNIFLFFRQSLKLHWTVQNVYLYSTIHTIQNIQTQIWMFYKIKLKQ